MRLFTFASLLTWLAVARTKYHRGRRRHQREFAFGKAADADRVVEIDTTDDLIFIPADLKGDRRRNRHIPYRDAGTMFTTSPSVMRQHEMSTKKKWPKMKGMAHDQPNTVTVGAGETKELTWTFNRPRAVLIGCRQPGHCEAGMKAQVSVEA